MNTTIKYKVNFINSLETKDYLPHAQIYPSTVLAQFHGTVFGIFGSFPLFRTSNFFSGLSTTDETLVVEMRIWCIKIGNVFALHSDRFVRCKTFQENHINIPLKLSRIAISFVDVTVCNDTCCGPYMRMNLDAKIINGNFPQCWRVISVTRRRRLQNVFIISRFN